MFELAPPSGPMTTKCGVQQEPIEQILWRRSYMSEFLDRMKAAAKSDKNPPADAQEMALP